MGTPNAAAVLAILESDSYISFLFHQQLYVKGVPVAS